VFAGPNHHALCGSTPTSNRMGAPSPRLIKVEGVVVLSELRCLLLVGGKVCTLAWRKGGSWWIGLREEEQEERDREP
jgi:hypothetical protein